MEEFSPLIAGEDFDDLPSIRKLGLYGKHLGSWENRSKYF